MGLLLSLSPHALSDTFGGGVNAARVAAYDAFGDGGATGSLREAKIFAVVVRAFGGVAYAVGVGVVVIVSLREAKIFAVVVRAC
jgi:hypothetical protein